MSEVGRFFDGILYGETDQAEVQARFRATGVLYEVGSRLAVSAPGSMFVAVADGEAMVEGFWYKNDASKSLAIGANTSGSTRIDRIVLRLNRVANTLAAVVLAGTPGAGAPALTQIAGGVWELPLAYVTVANGTLAITAGLITDERVYSKRLTSLDDITLGAAVPVSTQVQRRVLTVDPASKLLYFAEPVAAAPNILHNPSLLINQRAASVITTTGTFIADRWQTSFAAGTGTYAMSAQKADVVGSMVGSLGTATDALTMLKADGNVPTATTLHSVTQTLEGITVKPMQSMTLSLSFYAFASKAGTYGYSIEQVGGTLRYNGSFVLPAGAWTFVYAVIPWSTLSGTWVVTTAASLTLRFVAAAGSTNQASVANAWNSEGKPAPAGMTNSMIVTNDALYIVSPKLELGSLPTRYVVTPYQQDLNDCLRYLYVATGPAMAYIHATTVIITHQIYPMPLRSAPGAVTSVGLTGIGTAAPTAAQIAFLANGVYVGGLTFSSIAIGIPGTLQSAVNVTSSTPATGATAGQTGMMQVGSGVSFVHSAEI